MKLNWMKYRLLYALLSLVMIITGVYSLVSWGLPLGVDFVGGSLLEVSSVNDLPTEEATEKVEELGIPVAAIQEIGDKNFLLRLGDEAGAEKQDIIDLLSELSGGEVNEVRFESVGPSVGPELVKKTIYAIAISAVAILLWVAFQFKSFKFGFSAILAMFHDSFILVGLFALLGRITDAEVDFLFVTALLTTLSFSVHDTIVVYDRIREIRKKHGGKVTEVANRAVSETMRRSINNSVTIALMLCALIAFGGISIRWFAVALLAGTALGTYSSPFVAVPILITLEQLAKRIKR